MDEIFVVALLRSCPYDLHWFVARVVCCLAILTLCENWCGCTFVIIADLAVNTADVHYHTGYGALLFLAMS